MTCLLLAASSFLIEVSRAMFDVITMLHLLLVCMRLEMLLLGVLVLASVFVVLILAAVSVILLV